MDTLIDKLKEATKYMARINESNATEAYFQIFLRNYGFLVLGKRDEFSASKVVGWDELKLEENALLVAIEDIFVALAKQAQAKDYVN